MHVRNIFYTRSYNTVIFGKLGEFWKISEFLANPGISGKSGNFGKCRGKFSGIRGNFFSGIFEIAKSSDNFSEKCVVFIKTALRSSVHTVKISVKLVKFGVFSDKILPKMSRDRPGKTPEIPKKKVRFFSGFFSARRKDTAYFCKIFGKKFPGKSGIFREKISVKIRKIPENSGNSGKFRKKKCEK